MKMSTERELLKKIKSKLINNDLFHNLIEKYFDIAKDRINNA
jgi:hypothetical protein